MRRKNVKTWDELIEGFISGYKKWWPSHAKERVRKLLLLALKRKYEIKNYKLPFTKEEAEIFQKRNR